MIEHVFFPYGHQSSWGRHLLNKNNYHALEMHEIIFLFKMYMNFVIIENDST
jgi:hypothetical protein